MIAAWTYIFEGNPNGVLPVQIQNFCFLILQETDV
jgi:hypothetical protein